MIANSSVKFAPVPLLIMAATWTSPFRLGQVRANRLRLTPVLGSSQSGIEPKVIEQRDLSGKVAGRLRITPGPSPGEFHFEVEDFKQPIPARAVGSGKISDTEVRVQIVERATGTQLGLRAVVNGGRSLETRITLSLDRLSFDFIVDEKVRTLMSELQQLIATGASNAQLRSLARKMDSAMQLSSRYLPFVEQVKNSAVFTIVTTVRLLTTSVSPEEIKQHPTLVVLRSTAGLLAPSPSHDATIGRNMATSAQCVNLSQRTNLPRLSLSFSPKLSFLQPPCFIAYQDCMNVLNCGGHGQPIDALCWLGCATYYVLCEIFT